MSVILFFVVVEMEVPYGDLAVVLIGEFLLFTVSFRVFPEDGVPLVYLVERLVEQFLLPLAVPSVLFRDFFLVPYLHVKDSCEQVSLAACCHCCRCLHDCMF